MTQAFPKLELPCVLFALRREAGPFRKRCWRTFPVAHNAWLGDPYTAPVLAVVTGVGPEAVRATLDWLAAGPVAVGHRLVPNLVVSAGFAGALQPGLAAGDVVWATEVVAPDGGSWCTTWPAGAPALPGGRLLSLPRLVGDPTEKQRLGWLFTALAVDMESAELARQCAARGLSFGAVRAVSDAADEALDPRLAAVVAGGKARPWRLASFFIRRPALMGQLLRLARATRLAADHLAPILAGLLGLRQPWCGPAAAPAVALRLTATLPDRQVLSIAKDFPTRPIDTPAS